MKDQEFSTWNEVMDNGQTSLTAAPHVRYLGMFSFMFLDFKSLPELKDSKSLYLLMVLAGAHKGDTHSSNTYWMHTTSPTHWHGDAEMKASPCPPGFQCRVGSQARSPTRTTQQRFRACCVKTGRKGLISGDCFLCDMFSNPLDILLCFETYAFILMYDGCVH